MAGTERHRASRLDHGRRRDGPYRDGLVTRVARRTPASLVRAARHAQTVPLPRCTDSQQVWRRGSDRVEELGAYVRPIAIERAGLLEHKLGVMVEVTPVAAAASSGGPGEWVLVVVLA